MNKGYTSFFPFFFSSSSSRNPLQKIETFIFIFWFFPLKRNVGTDCCVLLRWPIQTASRRRRRSQISPVMNKELLGYLSFSSFSFILNVQVTVTEKKLTIRGLSRSIFSTKKKHCRHRKDSRISKAKFFIMCSLQGL